MAFDDPLATIRLVMASLVAAEQPTEDLPDLAAEALAMGIDSPALRELAGTPSAAVRDARDLFMEAAHELGVEPPTEAEARRRLARHWASQIVDGSVTPIEGAGRIWWDAAHPLNMPDDLIRFGGLASEWNDNDDPEYRAKLDEEIVKAARVLAADG